MFADLSHVRLEYFRHGDGPERVVFIHGFQASARIWHAVQQALPADRYTSIAINNRGAGASSAPPADSDYGVPIFAADAFELVSGLGFANFTLAGHSLGGATVAQFAVDHASIVKGLVLLDPADPDGRGGTPDDIERVIAQRMAARRAQQARGGGGDGIEAGRANAPEFMRQLNADIAAAPERRLIGSLRSMFHLALGARVRTLPMPVLLACGDVDALIPLSAMLATWAKYPPGTGLHVWHGIGHSPNIECPDAFAHLLRQFVEVTLPARAAAARA